MFKALLCSILICGLTAFAQERCEVIFGSKNFSLEASIRNLAEMHLKLEQSKIQGAGSPAMTALNYEYNIKERELLSYLKTSKALSTSEFRDQLKSEIIKAQKVTLKKPDLDSVLKEIIRTVDLRQDIKKIQMVEMHPGRYTRWLLNRRGQVEVELTQPFHIMAQPVTQMIHQKVLTAAGKKAHNPSKHKNEPDSEDYPVENVSFPDVYQFFIALNELSANQDPEVQKFLKELIPDHFHGDHYELPTKAQIEYAMKLAETPEGDTIDQIVDRKDFEKLHPYALLKDGPHPKKSGMSVNYLKPLYIHDQPVQLYTGTLEFTQDKVDPNDELPYGKDPVGRAGSMGYHKNNIVLAGYYNSRFSFTYPEELLSERFSSTSQSGGEEYIGFRIVRTHP